MKQFLCNAKQMIQSLQLRNDDEEIEYCLSGMISLRDFQKIADVARQKYNNYSEVRLLHENFFKHSLNLQNIECKKIDRKKLINVLCNLPFKIITISNSIANLLTIDWKAQADPVYNSLTPNQITEIFDPLNYAEKNFHNCGSFAYIRGLNKEDSWMWCAEPHFRYNASKLDKNNPIEKIILEIVHYKRFWKRFKEIPVLNFTYYFNHLQSGLIDTFFEDYPELKDLQNEIKDSIEKAHMVSKKEIHYIEEYKKPKPDIQIISHNTDKKTIIQFHSQNEDNKQQQSDNFIPSFINLLTYFLRLNGTDDIYIEGIIFDYYISQDIYNNIVLTKNNKKEKKIIRFSLSKQKIIGGNSDAKLIQEFSNLFIQKLYSIALTNLYISFVEKEIEEILFFPNRNETWAIEKIDNFCLKLEHNYIDRTEKNELTLKKYKNIHFWFIISKDEKFSSSSFIWRQLNPKQIQTSLTPDEIFISDFLTIMNNVYPLVACDKFCPNCNKRLIQKSYSYGTYLVCRNFPFSCDYRKKI